MRFIKFWWKVFGFLVVLIFLWIVLSFKGNESELIVEYDFLKFVCNDSENNVYVYYFYLYNDFNNKNYLYLLRVYNFFYF